MSSRKCGTFFTLLKCSQTVFEQLRRRHWSLGIHSSINYPLLTCDVPLLPLCDSQSADVAPSLINGVVTIPVSPSLLMVGFLDNQSSPRHVLDADGVAIQNSARLLNAFRHSFSSTSRVPIIRDRTFFVAEYNVGEAPNTYAPFIEQGDIHLHSYLKSKRRVNKLRKARRLAKLR